MELNTALSAGATLVSLAAGLAILERWLEKRSPQLASWAVSLLLFSGAAGTAWAGAAVGWNEGVFRSFYLLGAVLNVLFLGLGSVYLVATTKVGKGCLWGVLLFSFFCIGVLWAAPAKEILDSSQLPQGSEIFGVLPRILAAGASSLGALAVFGIAIFSIYKYLRGRAADTGLKARDTSKRNQAMGAGAVALGTLILSIGGLFNSVGDEMTVFAATILIGVVALLVGFFISDRPGISSANQKEKLD